MDAGEQQKMLELFGKYQKELYASLDVETKRNVDNIDIFEAMIRIAVPNVVTVAAGHHIMFTREGSATPGEFASADTLMFDHEIARAVWGPCFKGVLLALASEPRATRDKLLREQWEKRNA